MKSRRKKSSDNNGSQKAVKSEKVKSEKVKKERVKNLKDKRVTNSLISWKVLLFSLLVLYIFMLGQALIFNANENRITTLIGVLVYYLCFTCLVLAVLIGVFWRYFIGRPLKKLSDGARRVAEGDFTVQIPENNKNGKNELDVLIEDFNTMTRELNSNEMLKSDFITNVSHEIKTPLAVIQSYTKALKDGLVSKEDEKLYYDTIIEASQNLSNMVTNILSLNKLENQQIFNSPSPYPLGEQLRKCALNFMDKWTEKNIDFKIEVIDIDINYDQSLIEHIWNNLLSNAIKFTKDCGEIILSSYQKDGYVFVTVKDNGIGMDEETKNKIFEKFYQGDRSHSQEGNGLGLSIVKRVIEIVGAEIFVESSPNCGSLFTVKLKI